jgi:putative flippase GtrA
MSAILINSRERTRFLRFAIVGAIGAVVDFAVMNLLHLGLNFSLVLAGSISFIVAMLSNFTWNRYWTYPDSRSKPVASQLASFTLVSLTGLILRVPLLAILEPVMERLFLALPFKTQFFSPIFIADNVTLGITIIIVMFWNYFINRYWTYNDIR